MTAEPRIVVIADDLTGAADMGAAIAGDRPGCRCQIVPWQDDLAAVLACLPDSDVVCVSTDSRHLADHEASGRVRSITRWAVRHGYRPIKKIDSLLRGPVAAELRAYLEEASPQGAPTVLCPALPAHGRTTVDGIQHRDGLRLGRWPATDPLAQAPGDFLPALLPDDRDVTLVDLAAVRGGELPDLLSAPRSKGSVLVVDAVNAEDMAAIARALRDHPQATVIATSGLRITTAASGCPALAQGSGRTLVLSASRSPVLAGQLAELRSHAPVLPVHLVDPSKPLAPPAWAAAQECAVIAVDPTAPLADDLPSRMRVARGLTTALADVARDFLARPDATDDDRLVVIGGDLAHRCLARAGCSWAWLVGEWAPGLVVLRSPGAPPGLIVRSGGFGDAGALIDLLGCGSTAGTRREARQEEGR